MKVVMQKVSLILMIGLYVLAGINHFWHPSFYVALIPPYLPNPFALNIAAGIIEIIFGVMLIFKATRKLTCYGIIAMLIAFIPAHIYSIQQTHCSGSKLCAQFAIVWVRLFIIHPFLIAWPVYIKRYWTI